MWSDSLMMMAFFGLQVAQVGERGAEHRVGRNVPESRFLIKFLQPGLYRGDVGDDTLFRQIGKYLLECLERGVQRYAVDKQFGPKSAISSGEVKRWACR